MKIVAAPEIGLSGRTRLIGDYGKNDIWEKSVIWKL